MVRAGLHRLIEYQAMSGQRIPSVGVAILALQLAGAPAVVVAASPDGQFAIQGSGGEPCEAFVRARKAQSAEAQSPEFLQFTVWAAGYLTAFNQLDKGTVDIAPWQGMDLLTGLLEQYCEAHPNETFVRALSEMTRALYGQRLRAQSEIVEIEVDGKTVRLYDTVIRRAQTALKKLGFYLGTVDGQFGEATRLAVRQFQVSENLKKTGTPDQETLYRLFLKAPPATSGTEP